MIRIGKIVVGSLDIEGGEFTYGNRIALGAILSDESRSEYQRLKAAFRELYGYSCRLLPLPDHPTTPPTPRMHAPGG